MHKTNNSKRKMNIKLLLLLIFAQAGTLSCSHLSTYNKEEDISHIELPDWTNDDCSRKGNSYYFIGYGEGPNSAAAGRNALITSRQNALTCLFGGTIVSDILINEDNKSASYSSKTNLSLNYSHVNWSGYESVPERTFFLPTKSTRVYIQYRWDTNLIEKERLRLDKLSKQITETKALEEEVNLKQNIIEEQTLKLAVLAKQEQELLKIKNDSDKAVFRLQQLQANREEKSRDIMRVINNLYCGITIRQLIELFRSPDAAQTVTTSEYRYIDYAAFSWDQYLIKVDYRYIRSRLGDWPKVGEMDDRVLDISKDSPIKFIYTDYGQTGKGYKICG